ncbi:hypothetical protein [Streptomyces sp. DH12]|uniref:hypothetical protein n=1 Tax=Streptomyces sp. DH12 TaxID=2857010 RepID=UPI001E49D5FB|nr:hypothetical protein [Streptomyces sp. DH12]
MSPAERSLRARLASQVSWTNTLDPRSRTAKARAAAAARFERQAREMHPDATDEQIARIAKQLRSAHATRMALAAAKSRRAKAAAQAA